jgi:hypothetical protein
VTAKRKRRPCRESTKKWGADYMAAVLSEMCQTDVPNSAEEAYDDGFFWRVLYVQERTFVLETSHGNFQVTVTCAPKTREGRVS